MFSPLKSSGNFDNLLYVKSNVFIIDEYFEALNVPFGISSIPLPLNPKTATLEFVLNSISGNFFSLLLPKAIVLAFTPLNVPFSSPSNPSISLNEKLTEDITYIDCALNIFGNFFNLL